MVSNYGLDGLLFFEFGDSAADDPFYDVDVAFFVDGEVVWAVEFTGLEVIGSGHVWPTGSGGDAFVVADGCDEVVVGVEDFDAGEEFGDVGAAVVEGERAR